MTSFAAVVRSSKEQAVSETLETMTWPGELLLGYTLCRLKINGLLDGIYYTGLTPRRFMLVRKDHPDRVYTIYRAFVEQIRFTTDGRFKRHGLELKLGDETILLEVSPEWESSAREMVEQHVSWEEESPYLTASQFLQSVTDLVDLGQAKPAQALLGEHMASNPVIEIEPRTEELDRHISEIRQSLGQGAGMIVMALLYMLGQVIFGATWNGPAILLTLAAAIELIRWKQSGRIIALGLSLMAAFFNLGYGALGGSLLNGVLWVSFIAALFLVLAGKASRLRNLASGAVFALGFLAPLMLVGGAIASAPMRAQINGDYANHLGWITCQGCGHGAASSHIENGAYAVHVLESSAAFFAFPPVNFVPSEVDFDVQVPPEYQTEVGTFGVTCGFQNTDSQYLIELDPNGQNFAFLKQENGNTTALDGTYWHSLTGTRLDGTVRLKVSCANEKITLTVNGVKQGQVSAPGLSEKGKMGLFVRTWPETGPAGYKVLFDHESFKQTATPPK